MSIFALSEETCGTCGSPPVLVPTPDQCAANKIIGVAPAVVGFMTCDVGGPGDFVNPAAPTLVEIDALVTANRLSFKQVWNFVENGEAVDGEIIVDQWTPGIPYGKTKQFTFEDSYLNTVTDTTLAYWNDKTNPTKARSVNFCTIYKGTNGGPDLLTVYRTRSGYKLTPSRSYDATAKTNKLTRAFTLDLMWEDSDNELVAHIYVVGLYDAYKGTF